MIIRKKQIKFKNKSYHLIVSTYLNGRLKINLENKHENYEVTIDIPDVCLYDGNILLDPAIINSGILNVLKKIKIIKSIVSVINYNYVDIPVATLNMGKLREYDAVGVKNHFEKLQKHFCEVLDYEK